MGLELKKLFFFGLSGVTSVTKKVEARARSSLRLSLLKAIKTIKSVTCKCRGNLFYFSMKAATFARATLAFHVL